MSLSSEVKLTEVGCLSNQNASPDACESLSKSREKEAEDGDKDEEDEEEDVDFNPFLKETPSPEASSSLSSDIEELDGDGVESRGNSKDTSGTKSSKPTSEVQNCVVGNCEHGEEEIVMQTRVSPERLGEKELHSVVTRRSRKRKSHSIPERDSEPANGKGEGSSSMEVNDVVVGELSNTTISRRTTMHTDDDDAICMRTRARYSLASFTLDELEAFLQETDDDDELQNADDEEEYKKFLAAVLQGQDGDGPSTQENENMDDEDEDNDADFEIELEEALESDVDESKIDMAQKENDRAGRRPETRQNRRQKSSLQHKKKLPEQSKRPLRPLIPILPNGPTAALPNINGKILTPEIASSCLSPIVAAEGRLINGFTPSQVGQLYSLFYEHIQLLIQIFSLSILDSSKQNIASQVQGLIFEMLHKRDAVLACRSEPYPAICFRPPYVCSSVPDELPQQGLTLNSELSSTFDAQGVCSTPIDQTHISPSRQRCAYVSNAQAISNENVNCSSWLPPANGPVLSVLDVAPLNLVRRYMDDVNIAIQEYRRRHVESSCDSWIEREPLFPLPCLPSLDDANCEASKGKKLPAASTVLTSPCEQPPRRTLAATLIENTKKQSLALVPKEIARLVLRFFPLFNPSLFPHKPPPSAVTNRVLFTDAEDELLARGLMEYNSDWKAIQQQFLPCKSKHQIFVRQKNRCSSKAPENPIKAVRRLKVSPLTEEEIERIQEGLKVFKLDWMSVWRFVVPHRDPSLLPRLYRTALGTQKSYKQDAATKERRRLYESKRRRNKAANLANWQLACDREDGGEINSGEDYIENPGEAYVHEAFLSDWRPGTSSLIPSEHLRMHLTGKSVPIDATSRESARVREQQNNYGSAVSQLRIGNMEEFSHASNYSQHPAATSQLAHVGHSAPKAMQQNCPVPNTTLNTSRSQLCSWPHRSLSCNSPRLVKLAPDLPPVNLPPSVRVISQSALRSDQCGASTKFSAAGVGTGDTGMRIVVPQHPEVAKSAVAQLSKARREKSNSEKENVSDMYPEESGVMKDKFAVEERGNNSDLHMHPLLFRAPEDGCLPYYPLNCSNRASSTFSFFSGNQHQLNLSPFNSNEANCAVEGAGTSFKMMESTLASCSNGFHPLLQRTDIRNSDLVTACSTSSLSAGLELNSAQFQNPLDSLKTKSLLNGGPVSPRLRPSNPNEKANELDLEIYPSSTSTKEKDKESMDLTSLMRSKVSLSNSGSTMEDENPTNSSYMRGENCFRVCSRPISVTHESDMQSNDISRCYIDDVGDHSQPEIVMEQEELSDSDEEIGEHVEFECEEMADSEGEDGSGCEQFAEMQEKGVPSFVTAKVVPDADSDDQQWDLRTPDHNQGNICVPRKGTPPFLKLSLPVVQKDSTSGSWLSLDSCALGCAHTKVGSQESTIGQGSTGKTLATCRPNRSGKKTSSITDNATEQMHAMDMAQQLSLGPWAGSILRKPRKHVSRNSTSINFGTTTEYPKCDGKN